MNRAAQSVDAHEPLVAPEAFRVAPRDEARFTSHAISPLTHNFHLHPLLQLDALERLANYLAPKDQCRFVSPDIKLDSKFAHQAKTLDGRTLREVFERLEEPRSWIALYNVEAHPEYQVLLEQIIDCVRPIVEREQSSIFNIGGFIFISAPPAVTPFHIDRENNFWLQIRGQKRLTVFDHTDRSVVSAQAVEAFICTRNLEEVQLTEQNAPKGREFVTKPGDGVYFPSTTPHMTRTTEEWAVPGDGVSVSIGVVFYTDYTRKQARTHQCNAVLRRIGIEPKSPGESPAWIESLKRVVGHYAAAAKVKYREYNAPPGSY